MSNGGTLSMLSTRVPIGTMRGTDGRPVPVYASLEFTRALADLFERVGGAVGMSTDDLAFEVSTPPMAAAAFQLAVTVAHLESQVAALHGQLAALAKLAGHVGHLESLAAVAAPPVDWEHPGKIGAGTANSGKFSTLEALDKVNVHPADKTVDIKPTGAAGLLTIQPEAPGQIDNMELGKTAPRAARVLTLNKLTFTQPAAGATWTLADGKTFAVNNSLSLSGNDGAALNIGAGGTLGSAAYANTGDFAPAGSYAARSNTALAPVATDAATTQTLANSLRAVLLSVGIGS